MDSIYLVFYSLSQIPIITIYNNKYFITILFYVNN